MTCREHLDDGKGGQYVFFISHGDKQGPIIMDQAVSTAKISFMSSPVIVKNCTLKGNASIENWGTGIVVDSIRLLDSAAIDQWASDGTIQNCIADLTPGGGGPTGYSTAIVLRAKAHGNIVRFNTLVTEKFSALTLLGDNPGTKCYGNIMLSQHSVLNAPLQIDAIAYADYNFYGARPTFGGISLTEWKKKGFDAHALTGDPKFGDAAKHEFWLQPSSSCLGAGKVAPELVPHTDFNGIERPSNSSSIGAVQKAK